MIGAMKRHHPDRGGVSSRYPHVILSARHGESAEGCNWPQSDSFAGWPNSEGCVACSARKPSAAPTVKATAASRAKRSLIRIRREACRRGRPARAGRPHQMPHRLVGISDQTACGSLSLGEQTTAGNDVARTGPRGDSFAYSFRFAGPLGGICFDKSQQFAMRRVTKQN